MVLHHNSQCRVFAFIIELMPNINSEPFVLYVPASYTYNLHYNIIILKTFCLKHQKTMSILTLKTPVLNIDKKNICLK